MTAVYQKHGARFQYPRGWTLTEEPSDQEVCITVNSPDTAFWSLTLFFDGPSPDEVSETVIQAFQDEYEELDVYTESAFVGPHEAVGLHFEFMTLDLMNSAFVRICRTEQFTAVLLYQGTDQELEDSGDVLDAISASLEFDSSEEWPDFANRERDEDDGEEEQPFEAEADQLEARAGAEICDENDYEDDCDENEHWIPLR